MNKPTSGLPFPQRLRIALANDLTRTMNGPRPERAAYIAFLPLMDVALNGSEGVAIAESKAQQRKAA